MTKFVVTKTLSSSVILKTITVPLHRGRFVSYAQNLTFSVDSQNFPLGHIYTKNYQGADMGLLSPSFGKNHLGGYTPFGQIYTKNTNFDDFGGCKPTF